MVSLSRCDVSGFGTADVLHVQYLIFSEQRVGGDASKLTVRLGEMKCAGLRAEIVGRILQHPVGQRVQALLALNPFRQTEVSGADPGAA